MHKRTVDARVKCEVLIKNKLCMKYTMLINHVSKSETFTLKKFSDDSKHLNYRAQDVRNTIQNKSPELLPKVSEHRRIARNPNLKVNLIDKQLSDEMLSLKQNIFGRDALRSSRKFTSTLSPIVTSTILNHRLSNSESNDEDESEDNGYNELDFRHLLPESLDKKTLSTEDFLEHEGNVEAIAANQQNHLEDKIVDLRSLSHHIKIPDINELQAVSKHNCSCSRHATFFQSTYSQSLNGYRGTTLSYPFMPIYLPSYQHYFHYLPSIVMDYTEPSLNDIYDDDDNDDGVESNSEEEEDHTHFAKPTKRKTKNKCRAEQENVFKIEYDLLPRPTAIKESTTIQENKSKHLLSDILTGLSLGCKFQNCPNSLYFNFTSCVLPHRLLLLLLFVGGRLNYISQ